MMLSRHTATLSKRHWGFTGGGSPGTGFEIPVGLKGGGFISSAGSVGEWGEDVVEANESSLKL